MRLAVLTPVGPGHEDTAYRAALSALTAWRYDRGPFTEFRHFFFDDRKGINGRALARNVLNERAYKGWNADWVIHLDCNDMIHPAAYQAIGEGMREHPEAKSIWGCHSMIVPAYAASATAGYDVDTDPRWPDIVHIYRTRFDISPLTWETFIKMRVRGTLGTLACIDAKLCYAVGFLPELPAAEFYEHTHAVLASAPFWKLKRPVVICDRVGKGAGVGDKNPHDPLADHSPRLNAALRAVNEVWDRRGRQPLTYFELEERNISRFRRRQDYELHTTVHSDWSEMMTTENPLDGQHVL